MSFKELAKIKIISYLFLSFGTAVLGKPFGGYFQKLLCTHDQLYNLRFLFSQTIIDRNTSMKTKKTVNHSWRGLPGNMLHTSFIRI